MVRLVQDRRHGGCQRRVPESVWLTVSRQPRPRAASGCCRHRQQWPRDL